MSDKRETYLLSGAYALDAVTPEEAQALEAAMAESEELRGEVVGLTDTAVALGLAVRPAMPPASLRASLLQAIEETPQEPAEEGEPEPDHLRTESHVVPRRRRRLLRRPAVLLTAAGLAVLLFGGGVLVQRALIEPQLEYSQIVAASDAQHASHPVAGGGTARLDWSQQENATAVELTGVSVPRGKVLQLWRLNGSHVTSAGLYQPQGDAKYALLTGVPAKGERIAVSVEPEGGSTHPTTVPIVALGA